MLCEQQTPIYCQLCNFLVSIKFLRSFAILSLRLWALLSVFKLFQVATWPNFANHWDLLLSECSPVADLIASILYLVFHEAGHISIGVSLQPSTAALLKPSVFAPWVQRWAFSGSKSPCWCNNLPVYWLLQKSSLSNFEHWIQARTNNSSSIWPMFYEEWSWDPKLSIFWGNPYHSETFWHLPMFPFFRKSN